MISSNMAYLLAGGLIAIVAGVVAQPVISRPPTRVINNVGLSAEDYIEIQQLYGMYARDVDPGSTREASWMFTPDAHIKIRFRDLDKREQIEKLYADTRNGQAAEGGVRHYNTSYVIVGTPDGGARGSSYMLQVERKTKDGPAEVTLFGKYEDKLVRTPDGWRIKERVFMDDSYRGSRQEIVASPVPGNRATDTTGL